MVGFFVVMKNKARGAMIENASALFSQIMTGMLLSRMAG
jgi:hypothetical protein